MKIYYNGRYVKNVLAKYSTIPNLTDYFEYIDSTRLSKSEHEIIDLALFDQKIQPFLEKLKHVDPVNYWLIEKYTPHIAHEVTANDGLIYYSLLFRNGVPIRIPKRIYKQCPRKQSVSYFNSFVAAPPYEQLKLEF